MSDTIGANDTSTRDEGLDLLDVREIPPAQRHPTIFARFNGLAVGASFVLVNDHDPKPLFYQLNFEHSGQLGWEYLEQGPRVWRVRISRTAAEPQSGRRQIPLHSLPKEAEQR